MNTISDTGSVQQNLPKQIVPCQKRETEKSNHSRCSINLSEAPGIGVKQRIQQFEQKQARVVSLKPVGDQPLKEYRANLTPDQNRSQIPEKAMHSSSTRSERMLLVKSQTRQSKQQKHGDCKNSKLLVVPPASTLGEAKTSSLSRRERMRMVKLSRGMQHRKIAQATQWWHLD